MESLSQIINSIMTNVSANTIEPLIVENISPQLSEALQKSMVADLELMMTDAKLQTNLDIDNQSFAVEIRGKLPTLTEGESLRIPVKITSDKRLIIQPTEHLQSAPAKTINNVEGATKLELNFEKQLKNIQLEPLKLDTVIAAKMEELHIPEPIREQVMAEVPKLQVVISSLGNVKTETEELLQPLYNTIKQLAENVGNEKNISNVKSQLKQNIAALTGKQIGGEVTQRINNLTVIKTDLGSTYFNFPVKIEENEALILTLDKTLPIQTEEKNFLQQIVDLLGAKEVNVSSALRNQTNILSSLNIPEQLVTKQEFVDMLANKIPAFNKDFITNTANFYQAAVKKDSSIWLGKENIIHHVASTGREASGVMAALDNMVASSVKETPLWRIVEIPVYADNQITPLKVALKKEQAEEKESADKRGTRFVVETQFSKLGSFQFDGFVQARERKLDLIIRSTEEQKKDFYDNIINLFKNTLYNLDYTGNVKINNRDNFINFYQSYPQKEGLYI